MTADRVYGHRVVSEDFAGAENSGRLKMWIKVTELRKHLNLVQTFSPQLTYLSVFRCGLPFICDLCFISKCLSSKDVALAQWEKLGSDYKSRGVIIIKIKCK